MLRDIDKKVAHRYEDGIFNGNVRMGDFIYIPGKGTFEVSSTIEDWVEFYIQYTKRFHMTYEELEEKKSYFDFCAPQGKAYSFHALRGIL